MTNYMTCIIFILITHSLYDSAFTQFYKNLNRATWTKMSADKNGWLSLSQTEQYGWRIQPKA